MKRHYEMSLSQSVVNSRRPKLAPASKFRQNWQNFEILFPDSFYEFGKLIKTILAPEPNFVDFSKMCRRQFPLLFNLFYAFSVNYLLLKKSFIIWNTKKATVFMTNLHLRFC